MVQEVHSQTEKSVALLERELYKARQSVSTSKELQAALKDLLAHTQELERMVQDKYETQGILNASLGEKPILPLFQGLQKDLNELDQALGTFKRERARMTRFLQELRTYRYYGFSSVESLAGFFRAAMRGVKTACTIRPSIIGLADVHGLARSLDLDNPSNYSVQLPRAKMEAFLKYVVQNKAYDQFMLNTPSFKCMLKSPGQIYVEASGVQLKRLDECAQKNKLSIVEK